MKEPVWIRTTEALAFHAQLIGHFGGHPGIRDLGMLESALARPQNLFAYKRASVGMAEFAAAYAFGLSQNHPFVDGNKRMAMQTAFVFLEFNEVNVTASQEDACLTFLSLAAGKIKEAELAEWFARNSKARSRAPAR